MIELLRKKKETEQDKEVVYYLDDESLEQLANIDWSAIEKYLFWGGEVMYMAQELTCDLNFLSGVADTLPNNERMKKIIDRIAEMTRVMDLTSKIRVKEVIVESENCEVDND